MLTERLESMPMYISMKFLKGIGNSQFTSSMILQRESMELVEFTQF
jgi:hypothetical protein